MTEPGKQEIPSTEKPQQPEQELSMDDLDQVAGGGRGPSHNKRPLRP